MSGARKTVPADNVEESYPLSPTQQDLLFDRLAAPQADVEVEQLTATLPEEIDATAFREAWERVTERHAILRTGFRGDGFHLRQEVYRHVRIHFEQKDWPGLSPRERDVRLDAYLQAERRRGFDLSVPPLVRLALFNVGPARHIFTLTYHRLLLDDRALVVLLNEVFNLHDARSEGRHLQLPPARPYRDYIEWLRKRDWSTVEMFWRNELRGFVTPTPLVVAHNPRTTPENQPRPGFQQLTLSTAETDQIRSVARQNGLSVSTLVQGTWALLLSRYSGEEDVVFGVVRACRQVDLAAAETIVGPFSNLLPIRVRVSPELRVLEWLKELRRRNLALSDHEHTPLLEIQRWSDLAAGVPLFHTAVHFQDPPWPAALRAQGGRWQQREFAVRNRLKIPLWTEIGSGPEMTVKIGYDQGRFDDAAIARMLGHFRTLLAGMVADPWQSVADLPLLTDAERQQLLVEWKGTQSDYPRSQCLPELFEAQVERTPNAVALVYGKEEVSYRELDNQANRVSRHLRSLSITPDVPVGICAHRSGEMVAGLIGILKAGGACLPLDPAGSKESLLRTVSDSGARVLLLQESLQRRFNFQIPNCKIVSLDGLSGATVGSEREAAPRPKLNPDRLAYVIYTSDANGMPKGVELTHRALANLITWHQRAYCVTPEDRAAQIADSYLGASLLELWPYLTAGAAVCIMDDRTRSSTPALLRWLDAGRITIGSVPTFLAEDILRAPWPAGAPLRVLLTGGERLHRCPDRRLPFSLVNQYRSAENTGVVTCARVVAADHGETDAPAIGRPIANVTVYVLDRLLRPVPVGVPGELHVGGDCLSRGYRNRPALTAERFIPDPFSDRPGARLYKTGDRVRWRADGNLEFLGRLEDLVKIRGCRIEPVEIELRLNRHPSVRECLVMARDDADGHQQLVAYFTLAQPPRPANKELCDFLRATLPDHVLPSSFLCVENWPLTAGGKVDRAALPVPERSNRPPRRTFVAPRNPIEATVTKIWSELLGRGQVSVQDNFFELGGHSLLAAQAVARLRESFNIQLSIRTLFEKPVAADLARDIERSVTRQAPRREPAITRLSRDAYRVSGLSSETGAPLLKST